MDLLDVEDRSHDSIVQLGKPRSEHGSREREVREDRLVGCWMRPGNDLVLSTPLEPVHRQRSTERAEEDQRK